MVTQTNGTGDEKSWPANNFQSRWRDYCSIQERLVKAIHRLREEHIQVLSEASHELCGSAEILWRILVRDASKILGGKGETLLQCPCSERCLLQCSSSAHPADTI